MLTYEKITGHILRGANQERFEIPVSVEQGITTVCAEQCNEVSLLCPLPCPGPAQILYMRLPGKGGCKTAPW